MNEKTLMELFLSQIKTCNFGTKVTLSLPVPYEDGNGNNTRVTATVTGDGFRPYKLWYDYYRPVFKPRSLPIELVYQDEEDEVSTLIKPLAEKYGLPISYLNDFPLTGKIKDHLLPNSPLGNKTIRIDNYECVFEQPIELAPKKLDIRYIFNEIVTIKHDDIVFRHERQSKELENHFPVWILMKNKFDKKDKQNFNLTKDTKPNELRETFVHHLEEQHHGE